MRTVTIEYWIYKYDDWQDRDFTMEVSDNETDENIFLMAKEKQPSHKCRNLKIRK